MNKIALDTNILLHSHGPENVNKTTIARELLKGNPIISSQVISEYLNVMKRLFKIEKQELLFTCSLLLRKCIIQPVILSTLDHARDLIERYDFQMFDGIIVASAIETNSNILYSEDMQHGLVVAGTLKIINPYL
jgi:predicted nucleic acid-binding protein